MTLCFGSHDAVFTNEARPDTAAEINASDDPLVADLVKHLDPMAAQHIIDRSSGLVAHSCTVVIRLTVALYRRDLPLPPFLNNTTEAAVYPHHEIRAARVLSYPYCIYFPRDPWPRCTLPPVPRTPRLANKLSRILVMADTVALPRSCGR